MYKYSAIIIEPRKHNAIEFVLNNVCDCLSDEWGIILFHGINNSEYVTEIVENLNRLYKNRIQLVNLNIDNLTLLEYSKLLCTKTTVYDYINTETFLVFQTDSMIIKRNAYFINNFLEYDYVGSPWLITGYEPTQKCDFIGNGGFSLRKKSKILEIIEKIDWSNQYEDLYFSTKYENIKVYKPEYNKALMFCVDEVLSEITFACHKPWFHKNNQNVNTNHYDIFKQIYPEVELLEKLQYTE